MTFWERQSLKSVREVKVNAVNGLPETRSPIGSGRENVVVMLPPLGHGVLITGGGGMERVKVDPEAAVCESTCPTVAVTAAWVVESILTVAGAVGEVGDRSHAASPRTTPRKTQESVCRCMESLSK